jgi:integrase
MEKTKNTKTTEKLTDLKVKLAKIPEGSKKPIRLFDGHGLYLEVTPSGQKFWRWKYRFLKKEKVLALGPYPEIGLKDARNLRVDANRKLLKGIDPVEERKAAKRVETGVDSFELLAREWEEKEGIRRTFGYRKRVLARLEADVFPYIGSLPITEIKSPKLLEVLQRIQKRGALETARRIRQYCSGIFSHAIALGRATDDPTWALRKALAKPKPVHMAAIKDPKEFGELLRAIDAYRGNAATKAALRMAPLVFVRPGELRKAEWKEIDFEAAMWRIPADRMKMRVMHYVPLSSQALEILRELEPLTNRPLEGNPNAPRYVFTAAHTRARPLSENGVLAALRRMGYGKEEMTGHGFRGTASTLLHELGCRTEHIEAQLAHAERSETKRAYNSALYLDQRKKMMQYWADYLDELKGGKTLAPPMVAEVVLHAPDVNFVMEEAAPYFAEVP